MYLVYTTKYMYLVVQNFFASCYIVR